MCDNKYCFKCKLIKSSDDFHKDKNRRDGLNNICKSCKRAYDASDTRRKHYRMFTKRYYKNKNNSKKIRARTIVQYLKLYPLDDECAFCNSSEKLEHGHLDYNFPRIYITVCSSCNKWMNK